MILTREFLKITTVVTLIANFTACKTLSPSELIQPDQPQLSALTTSQQVSLLNSPSRNQEIHETQVNLEELKIPANRLYEKYINLAQLHLMQGGLEKAYSTTQQALAIRPQAENARLLQAQILFRQNKIDLAELVLLRMEAKMNQEPEAQNLMALIKLKQKKPSEALQFFKRSLDLAPDLVSTRMNLGALYLTYRQINAAATQFERVLKLQPNNFDARLHLAVARQALGAGSYAVETYEEILEDHPEHPVALFNLAMIKSEQDQYLMAIKLLKAYLRTDVAKVGNNKKIFQFIHQFERNERAASQINSDEDIQKLADTVSKNEVEESKQSSSQNTARYIPSQVSGNNQEQPAPAKPVQKQDSPAEQAPVIDPEIEMLQRELNQ
jgi:tetratricopeptide (TPR) repeat protein